jgi:TMEM175 potassium channel family protein
MRYDHFAGQNVERLAALSDGIFAVAMTLLVLDLHVPTTALSHGLRMLVPQFVMYLMSFMTLGIFWIGQQTQLNQLARAHRSLTWMHLLFLFGITLTPFSTRLLAEYPTSRIALLWYWANILLVGVALYISWICALQLQLLKPDIPAEVTDAIKRRIVVAQSLYALGALLSVVNTYWSIGWIVLVQFNYVIATPFGLARLERPHRPIGE